MNALIKKEIRLLLPAWLAVLLLEGALPWMLTTNDPPFEILPYFFFLGVIVLAISSFGREFGSGTFQMLMSQPIERKRLWRTKIVTLAIGSALIFLAYYISCRVKFSMFAFQYNSQGNNFNNLLNFFDIYDAYRFSMTVSPIVGLVALVGGLWTTLLFRQIATGFWATILAPAGLATLVFYFIPARASSQTFHLVLGILAVAYILAGFWAARWLFYSAQDIGWTGGNVSFSHWRYFEKDSSSSVDIRAYRPIFALVRKEFQLHAITLIGALALLILQIAVFFLRAHYLKTNKNSDVVAETYFFWFLWLLIPLVIGCASVTEERKPGILDNQFCQPVSKHWQFVIKFSVAIILGVLLGGVAPVALETMATSFSAPNEMFTAANHQTFGWAVTYTSFGWAVTYTSFGWAVTYTSFGFCLAGFYASTLAKNFLQALTIATGVIVACAFIMPAVDAVNRTIGNTSENSWIYFNADAIPLMLFGLTSLITIPFAFAYASYLNFNRLFDTSHVWRRNILALSGSIIITVMLAKGIYYRPWELLTPLNPTVGPARLNIQAPPEISVEWNGSRGQSGNTLSVVLPDGRLWLKIYHVDDNTLLRSHALQNFQCFVDGSNWASAATGDQEIVGIHKDGTLWHVQQVIWTDGSARLNLTQIGNDNDWRQAANLSDQFLLLKKDGSLWTFGKVVTATVGPPGYTSTVIRVADPERFGGDTNWTEILPGSPMYVEKNDGSLWRMVGEWKQGGPIIYNLVHFNHTDSHVWGAEVRPDGTLWFSSYPDQWESGLRPSVTVQLGSDAKWKAAFYNDMWPLYVIALRNDGTLWKWERSLRNDFDFAKTRPTQLGTYSGWITLVPLDGYGVALAADGGLWVWGSAQNSDLLAPSRKPVFLGNIFSQTSINP